MEFGCRLLSVLDLFSMFLVGLGDCGSQRALAVERKGIRKQFLVSPARPTLPTSELIKN